MWVPQTVGMIADGASGAEGLVLLAGASGEYGFDGAARAFPIEDRSSPVMIRIPNTERIGLDSLAGFFQNVKNEG